MSFYDALYAGLYDSMYADIKDDIQFYLEYAQQKGSPILEIACGTGRVLIPLAQAGYEVWGIDSSPAMLAKAQEKISALSENVRKRIHLVQADMRNFQLDSRFPLVLIPFRSFLVLLTIEDQVQTLKSIRKHLKDNGVLIIDLFVPRFDYLAQDKRQASKEFVNPENRHTIIRKEDITYDHANQIMDVEYIFKEYDEKGNLIHSFQKFLRSRYIFRYEMEHLLKLSGFKLETVCGTFDKKPYNHKSGEMIFVAAK